MIAVVAECTGHPATTRVEHIEVGARRARQQRDLSADASDGLLMTMSLHDRARLNRWRRKVRRVTREELDRMSEMIEKVKKEDK